MINVMICGFTGGIILVLVGLYIYYLIKKWKQYQRNTEDYRIQSVINKAQMKNSHQRKNIWVELRKLEADCKKWDESIMDYLMGLDDRIYKLEKRKKKTT